MLSGKRVHNAPFCTPLFARHKRDKITLTLYIHIGYTILKGDDRMQEATVVSQWGNSKGIRMPVEVLRKAQIDLNDKLFFEVDENKRIILTRTPTPKQGTLEYLFKDYSGDIFQAELNDLGETVGNEKW